MKFRKKPVTVEAFQMTRERRMDNADWPAWLNQAWQRDEGDAGSLQRVSHRAELPDLLEVVVGGATGRLTNHLVSWDDWIVRDEAGALSVLSPGAFEAAYEPVEE